jgi:hypothetical protein
LLDADELEGTLIVLADLLGCRKEREAWTKR